MNRAEYIGDRRSAPFLNNLVENVAGFLKIDALNVEFIRTSGHLHYLSNRT